MAKLINKDTKSKLLEALDEAAGRMKLAIEEPDTDDLYLTREVLKAEMKILKRAFRETFKARKGEPEGRYGEED